MRPIRNLRAPSKATLDALSALRDEVTGLPAYADRVKRATALWDKKNDKIAGEAAFTEVKSLLTEGCAGAQRCNYCEDSAADEIEHFRPKALYPELAFSWENYLYACGTCNGPKRSKFAVFAGSSPAWTELERARNAPVTPPIAGDPVLLDPRREDPLDYLALDLGLATSTYRFVARPKLSPRDLARVDYTVTTMKLNERSYLLTGRKTTYESLLGALTRPAAQRRGFTMETLADALLGARSVVQRTPHRFVWEFMLRERARLPPVDALLTLVPEATAW